MDQRTRGSIRATVVAGVVAVLAAACGSGSTDGLSEPTTTTAGPAVATTVARDAAGAPVTSAASGSSVAAASSPTTSAAAPVTRATALPAVDVVDVRTGTSFSLASLETAGKPLLVWMWAPY